MNLPHFSYSLSGVKSLWAVGHRLQFSTKSGIQPPAGQGKKVYNYLYTILLVLVSTPLKNISQWEGLSHILWKIKNV